MSFIEELKRRNVIRVGVAYVALGWVLAQAADFLFDLLGAPEWAVKTFVVALLLGLPIVLYFAWAFELTPEGVKRDKDVDRSTARTHKAGRTLDFIIIAILALAVIFFAIDKFLP